VSDGPAHHPTSIGGLLRELAPQVLGILVRRHGRFDACEDAVQEALAGALSWPADGLPANPLGWLITTANRRLIDTWRNDSARQRREQTAAALHTEPVPATGQDDTLSLLVLCCHPSLTPPAQVALTLRAVGGLTTAEIARGLLVPEPPWPSASAAPRRGSRPAAPRSASPATST